MVFIVILNHLVSVVFNLLDVMWSYVMVVSRNSGVYCSVVMLFTIFEILLELLEWIIAIVMYLTEY